MGKKSKTPKKKTSTPPASTNEEENNMNKETYEALNRLSLALNDLDDKIESTTLSHYRHLTNEVSEAHEMMTSGAELIKATSTKYTLVGKVDVAEGAKLTQDLRKGAELVSTGVLVLFDSSIGASRSYRAHAKQSARGVIASLMRLVQCFLDGSALPANAAELRDGNTIGAQRTGAVWEACDGMVKVPKGNRAAMRRELLTWVVECNETMQEFQDTVDLGPLPDGNHGDDDNAEEEDYDDFRDDDDQYTSLEINIATACLALLKCSRGTLNVALKACECAGEQIIQLTDETDDETKKEQQQRRNNAILAWMNRLHSSARKVGDGVTELGMTMYPPMQDLDGILKQVAVQKEALDVIHEIILDAILLPLEEEDTQEQQEIISMTEEVTELAGKIRNASLMREKEVKDAVAAALLKR
mmetsp:Transcript_59575/g.88486  ORF Transcript_59575/g.88486 Transcript_59575/m.88486 type:complete len:415 (+) Transcript_59575:60-1304(+)